MQSKIAAIVINEKDNVATALGPLKAGADVSVEVRGKVERTTLRSDIPMGHKFALKDIEKGGAGDQVRTTHRTEHDADHTGRARPRP